VAYEQHQRNSGERNPGNHPKAIHESQETHLTLQEMVDVALRGVSRIWAGISLVDEMGGQRADSVTEPLGRGNHCAADIGLMEVPPPFGRGCNERDTETAAPVAK
jgi:hypothetical protein